MLSDEIAVAVVVAGFSIIILGGLAWTGQRRRQRRSFHWFGILTISAVLGVSAGVAAQLLEASGGPAPDTAALEAAVELNKAP